MPGAILFVAPFAWLISASFQDMGSMFSYPPHWIPDHPTLHGYKAFFGVGNGPDAGSSDAWRWFANSAFVATSVTVLQLFFNSLAAYAFAKRRFPGRDFIFMIFLGTMMVPGQVTLIPNYLALKHVPFFGGNDMFGNGGHGWLDSYYGLILPGAVSAFGVFLLRQYMLSIPNDLLDAARIDGAGEFRIFLRVVLPLCGPVAGRHRHLHVHLRVGGLLLAADHHLQRRHYHRAAGPGDVRGQEPARRGTSSSPARSSPRCRWSPCSWCSSASSSRASR